MSKPIQISIPKPCHENWEEMTPMEKGRFCESCQQQVYDFTNSSDREIINILKSEKGACGRLRIDQLNRGLTIPKEKNKFWVAATATLISFIGLGSQYAIAQEKTKTEHQEFINYNKTVSDKNNTISVKDSITIKGLVIYKSKPLLGVSIINLTSGNGVQTDIYGKFTIDSNVGDTIEISFPGCKTITSIVTKNSPEKWNIEMAEDPESFTIGTVVVKRTFFGRIFHKIGNWFR